MNRINRPRRLGFTLIELMVVILILAIVIAIIVPALGGARNAAKAVSTRALLTQVSNASAAWANDHEGQLPGYFTAEEMGDAENDGRGLTESENILLHLAGGPVDGLGTTIGGAESISVGPKKDATVMVNTSLIGTKTGGGEYGGYFTPDAKQYRTENGQEGEDDHKDLPDLVDAWGTPILAWRRDTFGPTSMGPSASQAIDQFAQIDSGDSAWFYWNTNAGFLKGGAVGKLTRNQNQFSMLGGSYSDSDRQQSLVGFLGSPAFPSDVAGGPGSIYPTQARADLLIHSAGPDGFYLGADDRGAKQFSGTFIDYARNFFNAGGDRFEADSGEGETVDLLKAFDDVIQTGN